MVLWAGLCNAMKHCCVALFNCWIINEQKLQASKSITAQLQKRKSLSVIFGIALMKLHDQFLSRQAALLMTDAKY